MFDFSQITVGIKTLHRDEQLYVALNGLLITLPRAQLLIADDGPIDHIKKRAYQDIEYRGRVIIMPYDSGFGAKSNAIADALETDYLLVGSDDFDFADVRVRLGVETMVKFLNEREDISIVSGRVNRRPYEFDLAIAGDTVTEIIPPRLNDYNPFACDLTVNFSLIRAEVFKKVRWDDDVKIGGGEHAAFFIDVKRAGFKTVCLPQVNINEQLNRRYDPEYVALRNRARNRERPCFDKRGIKKYIMADGQVDYDATNRG